MRKNAMRRNLRQSIVKSLGRYIAIVLIIALGAALFVGLLMTKTDMVATGQAYTRREQMYDLRFVSTYGWTDEQVDNAARLEGVAAAEGVFYQDVIGRRDAEEEDAVFRFYNLPEDVNRVSLRGGRMPEKPWECLADGYYSDDSVLGTKVVIAQSNDEDTLDAMVYSTYTVVGYAASPLYMDSNRGTTSVGSGSVECFYYIPWEGFSTDYYTQIDLTLSAQYPLYSQEYSDHLGAISDTMEAEAERLGQERFDAILQEAEEEYQEGYQEYQDGLQEYNDGVAEFEQELADARLELEDAEKKIRSSASQLRNAELQLDEAKGNLYTSGKQLDQKEQELKEQEAAVAAGIGEAEAGIAALEGGISAIEHSISPLTPADLSAAIAVLDGQIALIESGVAPEELAAQYDALCGQRASLQTAQSSYNSLSSQLATTRATLDSLKKALNEDIPAGYAAIAGGRQQIADGWAEIEEQGLNLHAGKKALQEAREELEQGWIDYEEGKLEGEQELADAWQELEEGWQELMDAREDIDAMEPVDVFVLDRNSNVGYNSLDSSSDIVSGVSRVFPVFFLLVASLVCITTMTRMIEEERTQIGTLKALGYSNGAIMSKYLIYAGSGAVLGCGLGVALGSTVIPSILWQAYSVMLYIQPQIVLTVDWPLCITVVLVYTGVMLLVTWYCCRRTLAEVPAELIRPKAPDAGRKILLEYLPFWNRISFLNKVTIRNIFRYRQRLAMMLVGIGGCTALLVTGFGLRDSIVGIVDYQFQQVTTYHLEVYFDGHQAADAQQAFLEELSDQAENAVFYHQSTVDLEFDNSVKEIYMISGSDKLTEFINMQRSGQPVALPGENEAVLSAGVAKALDIATGDTVTLRNADMQTMTLTVSGIYENHLYNYCFVSPQTVALHFGEAPEEQMAMVRAGEGQDHHVLGAKISEMDDVLNVSVSEDMAGVVGRMMDALDLVVVVVVVCAGLLAAIVLYNLTNININERIREIATIKVLGFNARETAAYVFKENLTLTVVGSVLGLFLGKLLLEFVMSQINIDMVWFKPLVQRESYLWAIALTIVSACIVNFVFYFKLETINMAEALKSVE